MAISPVKNATTNGIWNINDQEIDGITNKMPLPENILLDIKDILIILQDEDDFQDNIDRINAIYALRHLWEITDLDYKAELVEPKLGLLSQLIQMLAIIQEDREMLYYVLGCLWFLSRNQEAKILMCAIEFQLPKILMEIMNLSDLYQDSLQMVENILTNCSMAEENHQILFAPELGFLDYMKVQLLNLESGARPFQTCNLMIFQAKDSSLIHFLRNRIHEVVLNQLLSVGSNLDNWRDDDSVTYWALNFIVSFSTFPTGQRALQNNLSLQSFLVDILMNEKCLFSSEGMKAGIIFINLYSSSSSSTFVLNNHGINTIPTTHSTSLLNHFGTSFPKFLMVIHQLIDLALNFSVSKQQEWNRSFPSVFSIPVYHSVVMLRDLFLCVKNLSLFSNNHWMLLQMLYGQDDSTPFSALHQVLDDFLRDEHVPLPRGDGGGRTDSSIFIISMILECAINLHSSCFARLTTTKDTEIDKFTLYWSGVNGDHGQELATPKYISAIQNEFRKFLQKCLEIEKIPKFRNIPEDVHLLLRVIRMRLEEKEKKKEEEYGPKTH